MGEFRDVAAIDDIPVGTGRAVEINGRTVALFHTESGFFAIDNSCPHRGGPLVDGDLSCDEIVCPWHFWVFDLKTGRHADPRIRVATHEVKQERGRILLRVSEDVSGGGIV